MAQYETTEVKIMMKPGLFHDLAPDKNGIQNAIEEMARDGWVLISRENHGHLIFVAHTMLIFRRIDPNGY